MGIGSVGVLGWFSWVRMMALSVILAAVVLAVVISPAAAEAQTTGTTFTVNSTGNATDSATTDNLCDTDPSTEGAQCTLRAAIEQANATTGHDSITFNIPTTDSGYNSAAGVFTISPASALPVITDALTIDGYTQPGTSENTLAIGNDAVLKIELNGAGVVSRDKWDTLGAKSGGLEITAANSTVRGLVINRFDTSGVSIHGAEATNNRVEGNFIGTDASGTKDLGNAINGVKISDAFFNFVGGTEVGQRNLISGSGLFSPEDPDYNYEGDGVAILSGSDNTVEGNYIGTDKSGTAALGNGCDGVFLYNAWDNLVGGTQPGAGNLISGNGCRGVEIPYNGGSQQAQNAVKGNYIGTTATGTAALGNREEGVRVDHSSANRIGGAQAGAGNVISANGANGVVIDDNDSDDNIVQGNFIGTDKTGAAALGNAGSGVSTVANDTLIGGVTPGARNVISGNDRHGVGGVGPFTKVQGNYIGTDATGIKDLGNSLSGVYKPGDYGSITIGGLETGQRNVISGNDRHGVEIRGDRYFDFGNDPWVWILVTGNYIGTDKSGAKDLGNSLDGVLLHNTVGAIVGDSFFASDGMGTPPLSDRVANVIAFNDRDGVRVTRSAKATDPNGNQNAIASNSIFSNGGLGIDLKGDGRTANDRGDGDKGPNELQNFPKITSVTTTTIKGTLNSLPSTPYPLTYVIQFFSNPSGNEGKTFIGQKRVKTDEKGNASFTFTPKTSLTPGEKITATASIVSQRNNPSTSEFSKPVAVSSGG